MLGVIVLSLIGYFFFLLSIAFLLFISQNKEITATTTPTMPTSRVIKSKFSFAQVIIASIRHTDLLDFYYLTIVGHLNIGG